MVNSTDTIRELLPELNPSLFSRPNVIATGIGYKKVQGKITDDLCIICSVENKVASTSLTEKQLVPAVVRGIPTDVQPVGLIHALQSPTGRFRPAPGGVSIGHVHITAGTLGCLVKKNNKVCILSNNHVLANSNQAGRGDMILQPGPHDGGRISNDQIARLDDFIKIVFENEPGGCRVANAITGLANLLARIAGRKTRLYSISTDSSGNLVDCAIAEPLNQADVTDQILQIGKVTGIAEGALGMKVKKSGRTTGLTEGVIEQIYASVRVSFGSGKTALFTDQLIAGAMSQGGDSGSAVLSENNDIVGLLFAGSTSTTVINRIQNVFSLLKVTLP